MKNLRLWTLGVMLLGGMILLGVSTPIMAAEQVLTIALDTNPTNLDPRLATDLNSARVYQIVTNGLVKKDPQLNIVPDLAERWENPDDKTYVFYLRKGVKFHDGSEFTAEDVKYTFESILDPELKSPHAAVYQKIDHIELVDSYTVKFVMKEVFSPFLIEMIMPIVPKNTLETMEGKVFTTTLSGTGPFKLVEWTSDEQLVFEANPDYFEGAPKLAKVIYRIIPDETVRFLELKQGGIDFVQNAIAPDLVPVAEQTPGLTVLAKESVVINYLGFNLNDPVLSNAKVRQAMAYAIDRQAMIDYLLNGQATAATGLLSPANWAYESDVQTYSYDVEKAKALLDEAGYPDPDGDGPQARLKITYKTSTGDLNIRIGEVLQDQLKKIGIEVSEIQSFEWAKFYNDVIAGNFQIYPLRWVGITEPDILHSIFHSSMIPPNGRNRGHYANPRIDELTDQARLVLDVQERKQLYSEIQKILAEDLPYVFLWYPHNIVVMDEKVKGFVLYPEGNFASFKDMWIEE